jgi:Dolichyl-phosphate-mannose-protein mannosyltransferase
MTRLLEGRARYGVLAAILAVGFGLRIVGIAWGLHDSSISRRPHPDEWVVYWLWTWFDQHHGLNPCPAPSQGQCFFDWGSVFLYVSYGFHLVVGGVLSALPQSEFGPHADLKFVRFVLAGRLFSALISTATIVVVYWTARRLYGVVAGLSAALLFALSALSIQLAHFATPDSTTTFLVSCFLLLTANAMLMPSKMRFIAAGSLAGLAAGTEYHMLLLLVPLACAWFLSIRGREARERTGSPSRAGRGRSFPPISLLAVALLASVASFLLTNPYAVIDASQFGSAIHHILLIRTVNSGAQYQGRFDTYGPDILYFFRYTLGYGVGFALSAIVVAGLVWGIIDRGSGALLLLAWTFAYGVLVSFTTAKFLRYGAPLFPALAVLSGGVVAQVLNTPRALIRRTFVTALALAILVGGSYDVAYASLFTQAEPRWVAEQWLVRHASPSSLIGVEQLPNGLINVPYFVVGGGFRLCIAQFDRNRLSGPMSYFVTDGYALEEHPRLSTYSVVRFGTALRKNPSYRLVKRIQYLPSFLFLSFPLDGAPHDWRYPDREISIYRHLSPRSSPRPYCYPSISAAIAALYRPTRRT